MGANQYHARVLLGSSTGEVLPLGFTATEVKIRNRAGVPIHVNLESTGQASTDDIEVGPRAEIVVRIPTACVAVMSTSTSTSTADGLSKVVNVDAWGG